MKRRLLASAGLLLLAALAGCTSSAPLGPMAAASAPAPGASIAPADHVVVILEENESASTIMGSVSASYFNDLARTGATATNYRAIRHPSLPNYLALTSGTTSGHAADCPPASCPAAVRSIASTLTAAKRSWRFYGESMPAPCFLTNSGDYAVRHNPFAYYPEVTDDHAYCAEHDVPYSRFARDLASGALPDFVFISPNVCNDMHDCSIAAGDLWLSREVPPILASSAFTVERSLLVVVFDEGRGGNNTVPIALAGPIARPGATSARPYTHYSLLRTIELLLGLPPLTANDRNAQPMTDLLR